MCNTYLRATSSTSADLTTVAAIVEIHTHGRRQASVRGIKVFESNSNYLRLSNMEVAKFLQ